MKLILLFLILSLQILCATGTTLYKEWDSPEGMSRLQKSDAKENFWKLIRFYESQIRTSYCSVATSVIALNALAIQAPSSKYLGKYRMHTQEAFFSDQVCSVIDPQDVATRGMSLEELTAVLATFPVEVRMFEAQRLSQQEIRTLIISALKNPEALVLALYQRKELGQEGGGHWSPIAAYEEESDSFLVLDVARYKYPPVWIDASCFIQSMQTSNIYGKSRGFIILKTAEKNELF